jgi:hypothetical protein
MMKNQSQPRARKERRLTDAERQTLEYMEDAVERLVVMSFQNFTMVSFLLAMVKEEITRTLGKQTARKRRLAEG